MSEPPEKRRRLDDQGFIAVTHGKGSIESEEGSGRERKEGKHNSQEHTEHSSRVSDPSAPFVPSGDRVSSHQSVPPRGGAHLSSVTETMGMDLEEGRGSENMVAQKAHADNSVDLCPMDEGEKKRLEALAEEVSSTLENHQRGKVLGCGGLQKSMINGEPSPTTPLSPSLLHIQLDAIHHCIFSVLIFHLLLSRISSCVGLC